MTSSSTDGARPGRANGPGPHDRDHGPCPNARRVAHSATGAGDAGPVGMWRSPAEFEPSEEMSVMLAMINDFMRRDVIPLESELLFGDPVILEARLAAVQDKVRQIGLWAPNHPVEYGGLGLSMVD